MQRTFAYCNRYGLALGAVAFSLACFSAAAWGQVDSGDDETDPLAGVDIMRIEEDWVLDIADPEPDKNCPQVVTVFGPGDPSSGTHAIFELNHGTLPDFAEGGMQLQAWYGEYLIGYHSQFAPAEFNQAIERVSFTTQVRVRDHWLRLSVRDGHSLTWGDFGGTSSLRIYMSTWRENLNDWNPQYSIDNSRVSYGANRVNKFLRTAIRYYTRNEEGQWVLHHTDETDTYIHCLAEDNYAPDPLNEGDAPQEEGLDGDANPGDGGDSTGSSG